MPIFAYFVVMVPLLLGLFYAAEATWGPPPASALSTNYHGLPERYKPNPSVQVLTVREAPTPDMDKTASIQPAATKAAEHPGKPVKVATTHKKKTVKVARVRSYRAVQPRYARTLTPFQSSYGAIW
jgi:hypothetical protein